MVMMQKSINDFVKKNLPGTAKIIKKSRNFLTDLPHLFSPKKKWPDKSIVFCAVNSLGYAWSPRSLTSGLGGSEQAVIWLSREWATLGYHVTVFTKCYDDEGVYDGVTYLDSKKFNRFDTFDTLIIWRHVNLSVLDNAIKAKRIWLELQDTIELQSFTAERVKKIDKIFAKSVFQARSLPQQAQDKAVAISNGVVGSFFTRYQDIPKDPFELIYASSYYRGLEEMLVIGWPIIKNNVPEATFHIFSPPYSRLPDYLVPLLKQPGVFHRGSVGVDELMKEKASSSVHYYATTVRETDSLSLRESVAVGCVPVTTDFAFAGEKCYCVRVAGEPQAQQTQEAVAWKIVELLKDQQALEKARREFKDLVKHDTWENVARQWLGHV